MYLLQFCEEVAFGLRDKGLRGRTVTLKARYASFRTVTRTRTLDHATNLGPRLYTTARELLEKIPAGPLRLLGVQVSNLEDIRLPVQEKLFGEIETSERGPSPRRIDVRARLERATEGIDRLRKKFGKRVVIPATLLGRESLKGADGSDGRTKPPRER